MKRIRILSALLPTSALASPAFAQEATTPASPEQRAGAPAPQTPAQPDVGATSDTQLAAKDGSPDIVVTALKGSA